MTSANQFQSQGWFSSGGLGLVPSLLPSFLPPPTLPFPDSPSFPLVPSPSGKQGSSVYDIYIYNYIYRTILKPPSTYYDHGRKEAIVGGEGREGYTIQGREGGRKAVHKFWAAIRPEANKVKIITNQSKVKA